MSQIQPPHSFPEVREVPQACAYLTKASCFHVSRDESHLKLLHLMEAKQLVDFKNRNSVYFTVYKCMSNSIPVKPEKDSCLLLGVPPTLFLHFEELVLLQSSKTVLPAASFPSVKNRRLGFHFLMLFFSLFHTDPPGFQTFHLLRKSTQVDPAFLRLDFLSQIFSFLTYSSSFGLTNYQLVTNVQCGAKVGLKS